MAGNWDRVKSKERARETFERLVETALLTGKISGEELKAYLKDVMPEVYRAAEGEGAQSGAGSGYWDQEVPREAFYKENVRGLAESVGRLATALGRDYRGVEDAAKGMLQIAEYFDRRKGTAPPKDENGKGRVSHIGPDGKPTGGQTVTVYPIVVGEPEALNLVQKARQEAEAAAEAAINAAEALDIAKTAEAATVAAKAAQKAQDAANRVANPQREAIKE